MLTVEVEVKGTKPLLQSKPPDAIEQGNGERTKPLIEPDAKPRAEAETKVYRAKDGACIFPSTWITESLKRSGMLHKIKGAGNRRLGSLVAPAVHVLESEIPLLNDDGVPVKDFEVDHRMVRGNGGRGNPTSYRPRFDDWGAKFTLEIRDDLLPERYVHALLVEAGDIIGWGSYRSGPFGKFRVMSWQVTRTSNGEADDRLPETVDLSVGKRSRKGAA